MDMETSPNNRPLNYVKDDIKITILKPNLILYGESSKDLIEEEDIAPEDKELGRQAKYRKKCKDAIREKWRS